MNRFPSLRKLAADVTGWGFYLCTNKELRPGRKGEFLSLTLQDATGRITGRVFDDVEHLKQEFEAGEFVKVQGRTNTYNGRLQLVVDRIRRLMPDPDRAAGFKEEECVPSAPRPLDEMWTELEATISRLGNPFVRALVEWIVRDNEAKLRIWPAAQTVHHAYRGGFLEHILQIARVATMLADVYRADADIVLAGAVLHDIGKLQELNYENATAYSREGYMLGHIPLGMVMVRDAARAIPDFPQALLTQIEHIVLSHHGSMEYGSPVEPMTVEAFIVSMADDLDAKIHQVRSAVADDIGDGEFTGFHQRFGHVLYKGPKS
ncbi:MAG: HD domain-containing protein [Acidobacteria bacterium]|nr:HD domain-containing protein [Acidobacteriota bacterium]